MKYLLTILLSIAFLRGTAQNNCPYFQKYMNMGDSLTKLKKPDFEGAINAYSNASLHCPSRAQQARQSIIAVFRLIEGLRTRAEQAETKALAALTVAKQAKGETQVALSKANKIINAFYFYKNRFALAINPSDAENFEFYFIDKEGHKVEKLNDWDKAEQFELQTGLAKVRFFSKGELLIDTFGKEYPVVYTVDDIRPRTTALDLSNTRLDSFPMAIFNHPQLEVLILSNKFFDSSNKFKELPAQIGSLKKQKYLYLYNCGIEPV
jgi:hypothetical protein